MSFRPGYFTELIETFGRGWNRFWFLPSDPLPCAVLRIAVGLLVLFHLLSLSGDIDRWYARAGLLPPATVQTLVLAEVRSPYVHPSYFNYLGPTGTRIAHGLAIALAAAFTAGAVSRITGVFTALALLAYIHRLPLVAGHADPALVFLVLYLSIGPADACLSVRRWLRGRRTGHLVQQPEQRSYWATLSLRLIQVHLCAFVAMQALVKLNGDAWWNGEAIWELLAQTHSRPFDLTWLRDYELLVNFWTHAIVYYQLAFPVLIWNRLARPLLLVLGVAIWLSLALATGLLLFALAMIVGSLAFVPASSYRALSMRLPVPAR
ncbi:MAG: hypothetical protein WD872_15795 [Pirellulaceae bacterium]